MAEPIENYALIGDCRSAALIGLSGSIDWLCMPRFDSASLLSRISRTTNGGAPAPPPPPPSKPSKAAAPPATTTAPAKKCVFPILRSWHVLTMVGLCRAAASRKLAVPQIVAGGAKKRQKKGPRRINKRATAAELDEEMDAYNAAGAV